MRAAGAALTLTLATLLVGVLPAPGGAQATLPAPGVEGGASAAPTVVWLVRHAERSDDGPGDGEMMARERDPGLSVAGRQRAQLLRGLLADVELDRILSTDYRRTRATADPVAAAHGLAVESYDPRDLEGLARRIRSTGGRWLVVGHSNTTPELATALGGESGEPVGEFEYDRLYQIVITGDGAVETTLLRFGS